ncbi:helix-turn-helix transcriptional regulator [Spirillospora sp. NPDC029432]|uniref:helix-turn-helix domain-containing protein n=1 Tax=Spirillospora sp. NPDC029432 TaxID=3154599 RepID=UPI0034566E4D
MLEGFAGIVGHAARSACVDVPRVQRDEGHGPHGALTLGDRSIPQRVSHPEMYARREMDGSAYGPVKLPAMAWQREETRSALIGRDVAALLRIAQRYAGASQARLAHATGIGQGRMNEIINGKRMITRLDVYERIADGLAMPDASRALLGLAPSRAADGPLTGQAEISRTFASQERVSRELREHARSAGSVDILAVRALGLVALNDSLLRGPLTTRDTPVRVRMLLLDPDAPAAAQRAREIAESVESFAAGIRLSLARLAELDRHPRLHLELRLYGDLPTWRMASFDETLYLSAFGAAHEGHRSGVYKLTAAADGMLHAGFRRYYDDMWRRSWRPERGGR